MTVRKDLHGRTNANGVESQSPGQAGGAALGWTITNYEPQRGSTLMGDSGGSCPVAGSTALRLMVYG
ncbi:MAG: hypothetical protein AAGA58_19650, partial [Verrucomicrobiota bacterium]